MIVKLFRNLCENMFLSDYFHMKMMQFLKKKRVQKKNHGFSFEVFKSNVVSTMNHAYKLYSIWDLLARVFFCEIKSKVASKKKIDYKSF